MRLCDRWRSQRTYCGNPVPMETTKASSRCSIPGMNRSASGAVPFPIIISSSRLHATSAKQPFESNHCRSSLKVTHFHQLSHLANGNTQFDGVLQEGFRAQGENPVFTSMKKKFMETPASIISSETTVSKVMLSNSASSA